MSTVFSCTSRIVSRCRYALIIVPLIHCSLSSVAHGFMSFRQEQIRLLLPVSSILAISQDSKLISDIRRMFFRCRHVCKSARRISLFGISCSVSYIYITNKISRICYLLWCKYNIYVNSKQEKERIFFMYA